MGSLLLGAWFAYFDLYELFKLIMLLQGLLREYRFDHFLAIFAAETAAGFVCMTLLPFIYLINEGLNVLPNDLFLGGSQIDRLAFNSERCADQPLFFI